MTGQHDIAFEILVREHHRMLLAYLRSLLPAHAPVDDLAQDTFLVAYRRLAHFDQERDFGRWLRGIARMKVREWWRSRREVAMDEETLTAIADQYGDWFSEEKDRPQSVMAMLAGCLDGLSGLLRQAVDQHYLHDQPIALAASVLGTSEDALKKRLQRAREELALCLGRKLGQEAP